MMRGDLLSSSPSYFALQSNKNRSQQSAKALPWVIILLTALVLSVPDNNFSYRERGIREIAVSNHLGKQATLRQVECTGVPGVVRALSATATQAGWSSRTVL
jgi:hypothetical protein